MTPWPTFDVSDPPDGSNAPASRRASLSHRLLQLALALCLIGLVPGLLALWGERRAAADAAWHDPSDDIQPEAVALDLALLSLAGTPDEHVLTLSIEAGDLETARVLLVFGADSQRRHNGPQKPTVWLAVGRS
jgi:hypothetical protein